MPAYVRSLTVTQPYPGLRPFRRDESEIFFGREEYVAKLATMLHAHHFVAVVGPSGCGKSSLVTAGLLPELSEGQLVDIEGSWFEAIIRPGDRPFSRLAAALVDCGVLPTNTDDDRDSRIGFLDATLRRGPLGLVEALAGAESLCDGNLLIVVDQFEEIFRFRSEKSDQEADAFIAMLLETVRQAEARTLRIYIMLTMRSDYLGDCNQFSGLPETINDSQFLTPRPNREQRHAAIAGPAAMFGGDVEPALVNRLLNDMGDDPDQLPIMQHALMRMWSLNKPLEPPPVDLPAAAPATEQDEEPVLLTVDCYEKVGGWQNTLSNHADEAFDGLGANPEHQRVAEMMFRSLTQRGPNQNDVRRPVSVKEVAEVADVSTELVKEIAGAFRRPDRCFLTPGMAAGQIRGDDLADGDILDISHESLIRQWTRLRNWARKEGDSAVEYRRLESDAVRWKSGQKDFLQSPELDIALKRYQEEKWTPVWAQRYGTDFDLAIRYLEESQAEKKRRDAREEAQRNELASERARTEQEVQKVTRFRRALAGLVVVVAIISALAYFALQQRKIATALSIATRAYQLRDERLDTALLLATEAQRLSNLPETRGTLLTAAHHNPRLKTYLNESPKPIGAIAFSHDGKWVATGDYDGNVVLLDAEKHNVAKTLPKLWKEGAVRAIAFSPDGRSMAVSGQWGAVVLVALQDLLTGSPKILPRKQEHAKNVWGLTFSADSKLLVSGDSAGKIVLWDVITGVTNSLPPVGSDIRGIAFDPSGTLFAGCGNGSILLYRRQGDEWVADTREFACEHPKDPSAQPEQTQLDTRAKADAKKKAILCLATSADGKYLAAARKSGVVDVYDLSALSDTTEKVEVAAFGRHEDWVTGLAFSPPSSPDSPEKTRLISSAKDGTLRLWEMPSMEQVGPPFTGHVGRVLGVAFSRDNKTVASGGEDRRAILWDTSQQVATPMRKEGPALPFSIAFSPDGEYEALGYTDGSVSLVKRDGEKWAALPGRQVVPKREDKNNEAVPIVAFSGDSRLLVTTTAEGKLLIHDARTDRSPLREIDAVANSDRKKITAVCLNKDGSLVAAALNGKDFKQDDLKAQALIWKVPTGEPVLNGPLGNGIDEAFLAIAFSPDSRRLVTGGDAYFPSIWSLEASSQQQPVKCRELHTGFIRSVAFSPTSDIFATASGDSTLILWNADTGKQIGLPLSGHQAPAVTAAFSADGKLLASGSDDRSVILWDAVTGLLIGRLTGHNDTVRALVFRDDGKRLCSGSWDVESLVWNLDPKDLMGICRQRANRNLSKTEWDAYVRSGGYQKTWPDLPVPGEEAQPK